ncbi:hypothetical protein HYH02_001965 [Chlamydomonas schloesseri]|uniref:Uncharacterized protein n=1 Tax=Chlamydomonas schloesseri TaxID=2026947 RepID=A0A835WUN5_9CHLO|nr:hypothetical protein HYH02_001965 [Chlamydomonas schloesseri]|eukprot:KAG2453754.1 hypothetical protein HYH02_001965 [Chlamydomonas schloesseri]
MDAVAALGSTSNCSSSWWTSPQQRHYRSSRSSSSSGCGRPRAAAVVNALYVGFLLWVCVAACGCANFMLGASAVADGAATALLSQARETFGGGSGGISSRRGAAGQQSGGDGTGAWGAHSSTASAAGVGPRSHAGRRGLQESASAAGLRAAAELAGGRPALLPVCSQGCLATGAYLSQQPHSQGGISTASDRASSARAATYSVAGRAGAGAGAGAGAARAGAGAAGAAAGAGASGAGDCVCDRAALRALYSYAAGLHDQLVGALTALAALFGATGLGLMAAADLLAGAGAHGPGLRLLGELQLVMAEGDRVPPPTVPARRRQQTEGQHHLKVQWHEEAHDDATRSGKEEGEWRCGEAEAVGAGGGPVAMPSLAIQELRVRAPTPVVPAAVPSGASCSAGAWREGRGAASRATEAACRHHSGQAAAAVGGGPAAASPFSSWHGAVVRGSAQAAPLLRLCSEPVAALAEQELRVRRCRASASQSGLGSREQHQHQHQHLHHLSGASDTGSARNVDASSSGACSSSDSARGSFLPSSRGGNSGGAGANFGHADLQQPSVHSCSPRVCQTGEKSTRGGAQQGKHITWRNNAGGGFDPLHASMGAVRSSAWLLGGFGGGSGAAGSFEQEVWELQRKRC